MIMSRGCCSVVMTRMHGCQHGAVHVGIVRHLRYRDNQKGMWKNETNKGENYMKLFSKQKTVSLLLLQEKIL